MNSARIKEYPRLSGRNRQDWLGNFEYYAEEEGYFEPLGEDYAAAFFDHSTTLLVTFETLSDAHQRPAGVPAALSFGADAGWSRLCLLAKRPGWFRDKRVYGYFDRLVDDGFFEDFDRVVFYGAGMCGYAAAAFSVASPAAVVVALQPQATLDPARTLWDHRWPGQRRTSFTDRYGYAPDMTDAAAACLVLFDPHLKEDAMHASLFAGPAHKQLIATRFMGKYLEAALERSGALDRIIDSACRIEDGDNTDLVGRLVSDYFRSRREFRSFVPYLRRLYAHLERTGRTGLMRHLCRYAVQLPGGVGFFRERLVELEAPDTTPNVYAEIDASQG